MMLVLLLIMTFILGMLAGAVVLTLIAFAMDKKEKNDGSKKKDGV